MYDLPSNLPLSEQFRQAGDKWADLDAAANYWEDMKSSTLSELLLAYADLPHNRAEAKVKASAGWKKYIKDTVEARRLANRAKVYLDSIRIAAWEQNSHEATQRQELRMTS